MKRQPVIIIGAGQAGLSVSYHLKERGIDHLILERGEVGARWTAERWDSFRLVTQNWQCRLPGFEHEDSDGFMTGRMVQSRLRAYADRISAPIEFGSRVVSVSPDRTGFRLETDGKAHAADNVVVATSSYHTPRIPAFAQDLDAGLMQLHSSQYKNPDQLPEGAVLVVGSGQSGWQIARELHRAGRRVHWSLGLGTRVPRTYRGRDITRWFEALGFYDLSIDQHPGGTIVRREPNPYMFDHTAEGPEDPRALAREGMRLHGRVEQADGTMLRLEPEMKKRLIEADEGARAIAELIDTFIELNEIDAPPGEVLVSDYQPDPRPTTLDTGREGITAVVWATGYEFNWSYVHADVFDPHGYPIQQRGVTEHPGLYFVGLHWLHTWGSGLLYGVGGDARYLAERIAESSCVPRDG